MNSNTLDSFGHQLEELNLVKCSVLPDELFAFVLEPERWSNLLDDYSASGTSEGNWPDGLSNARFEVKVERPKLWFEVDVPRAYPRGVSEGSSVPVISVKCEDVGREEQEKWQSIVEERWKEVIDSEAQYPLHVLICLHLLPELHDAYDAGTFNNTSDHPPSAPGNANPSLSSPSPTYHALFTSHHLISPQKRRSLHQWSTSTSLSLSGFAKLGYPGVIYAEGLRENVEEFVMNVKTMQWLALRLRFIEPLPADIAPVGQNERRWVEFEKVGEVVQEMRKLGRERYALEMGIGSAGAGVAK